MPFSSEHRSLGVSVTFGNSHNISGFFIIIICVTVICDVTSTTSVFFFLAIIKICSGFFFRNNGIAHSIDYSINITIIRSGKPKCSCDSLYVSGLELNPDITEVCL